MAEYDTVQNKIRNGYIFKVRKYYTLDKQILGTDLFSLIYLE